MDWGSAVGGIASAAGSIGDLLTGGYFSRKAWQRQKEAMQNAHQWEVEDLRKAGLNPILSAMGGSGASTGGLNGSMVGDTGAISRGVSNAMQFMLANAEVKKADATVKNLNEDTKLKEDQRYVQQALANVNRLQALINAENAYSLFRENRFWDQNKPTYLIKKANEAMPGLGGLVGILGGISNSSEIDGKIKELGTHLDKFRDSGGNGQWAR